MPRELDYNRQLLYMLDQIRYEWRTNPVILGGSTGSGGGNYGAPGGFVGQLPQKQVAGDTTESFLFTSGSVSTLVDNLNNIRAWEQPAHSFWADTTDGDYLSISSGSWYYEDGKDQLVYAGGNTPALTAPVSGTRHDLLTINSDGDLAWNSTVNYPTSFPTVSSKQLPLWLIYSRSSGSIITRYNDGMNHYILEDKRPYLGAPTFVPSTGSAYVDYQWYSSGSLSTAEDLEGVYYLADDFSLMGSYAYVVTTPSSGSLIANIEYSANNGTSWTSVYSGTKLEILSGDNYGTRPPDALVLSAGTIIRAALDDVGGGSADTLSVNLYGTIKSASGGGTVTLVSASGSQGVIVNAINQTTTPSITIGLGDITPYSVAATGNVTGANLSGTNTGDQTITLSGDVTGSGTGAITVTISDTGVVADSYSNANITVGSDGRIIIASSGSGNPIEPSSPADIASTSSPGASDFASAGDHVHRGLHSVSVPGGSFIYGDAVLVPSGGMSITQSSGSLLISSSSGSASLYPDPAYDIDGTASAGISDLASRGDHVHRGVRSIGVDTEMYGDVTLAQGTGMAVTQVGNVVTFSSSATGQGFGATGGRLTLVYNDPIGESSSSDTLYYMPYLTNAIELYDGASWGFITFDQTSIDISGYSDGMYDVIAYNNSGVLALDTLQWADDRYRGDFDVGYYYTDGRWTGKITISDDPTSLYLGTFRVESGVCHDSVTQRWLWNFFNRVDKDVRIADNTVHSYETAAWRNWNGDSSLNVTVVLGYSVEYKHALTLIADMSGGSTVAQASIAVYRERLTDWQDAIIAANASTAQMRYSVTDTEHPDEADGYYIGYSIYQIREYGGTGCDFNSAVLNGVVRL